MLKRLQIWKRGTSPMVIFTQGAVVIITGSAQGIGLAVAEHLLAEGAKVALTIFPSPHH